jgi:hypothetical protein
MNRVATLVKAKAYTSDEILDTTEFGLRNPQQSLIKFDLLEGRVQEVLNPSFFLCERIARGPCILKEFLLLCTGWWWTASHVIVDLKHNELLPKQD